MEVAPHGVRQAADNVDKPLGMLHKIAAIRSSCLSHVRPTLSVNRKLHHSKNSLTRSVINTPAFIDRYFITTCSCTEGITSAMDVDQLTTYLLYFLVVVLSACMLVLHQCLHCMTAHVRCRRLRHHTHRSVCNSAFTCSIRLGLLFFYSQKHIRP